MSESDQPFYNLRRLHALMAMAAVALLAATVWMVAADHRRPWKQYQRTFRDEIEPAATGGPRHGRPLGIEQIWLPDLTLDYHFQRVARFDRCVTCHQGVGRTEPAFRGLPQPYASHPRLDLFVGAGSPHPMTEFGCTICHDGQGSATDFTWASHTPNDASQRARWRQEHGWSANPHWDLPMLPARFAQSRCLKCHHDVTDLEPTPRFPDPPAEKLMAGYHLVRRLGCFGCHEMYLSPFLPKVGPSLRDIANRVDAAYLAAWIADPSSVRPGTRMPTFYGLHEHLAGRSLADARRFEAIEVRAVLEYLLSSSRSVEPLPPPAGISESPSPERGKRLFQLHGCLACHKHGDFPQGQGIQGPDLSTAGEKYKAESSQRWLIGWIRNPSHSAPRTLMPSPLLEPIPLPDGNGEQPQKQFRLTDPAADIAAYLMASGTKDRRRESPRTSLVEADLDELLSMHLSTAAPNEARELLGEATLRKKLLYVGRRTIAKRGCFGCHDIPGFNEDPQPIGPALSDWGRKPESQLAFGRVDRFIDSSSSPSEGGSPISGTRRSMVARESGQSPAGFYLNAVRERCREGFIWQKLRAPRSFDCQVADDKNFNEYLKMGRFTLTEQEREAIITFVLGLVADPPAERYVCHPDRARKAVIEGRKVLDKYACAECHTLQMERWTIEVDPAVFPAPPPLPEHDFLKARATPGQLAASLQTDQRGMATAELVGMPRVDATGKLLEDEDDDGQPIHFFTLWEPAVIAGHVWPVGGSEVTVPKARIVRKRPPLGGTLARLLYPVAIAEGRAAGSTTAEVEAWGWVPPVLASEGAMVQPAWLHEYLLRPTVIRPAAVLRMPQFNLSTEEAGKLVDYFAAVSGTANTTPFVPQGVPPGRAQGEHCWDEAMRLLLDRTTYCAKCHLLGDYSPSGQTRTILAPSLDFTGRRIRPEYVRRWLASPKSVLPYTAMPTHFPPDGPPLGQDLLPGSSREQLDAVTDLLLNYDQYLRQQMPIRRRVWPPVEGTPREEPTPAHRGINVEPPH